MRLGSTPVEDGRVAAGQPDARGALVGQPAASGRRATAGRTRASPRPRAPAAARLTSWSHQRRSTYLAPRRYASFTTARATSSMPRYAVTPTIWPGWRFAPKPTSSSARRSTSLERSRIGAAHYRDCAMRLNAFLARAGVASRRKADELIKAGRVRVNGERGELNTFVEPGDEVARRRRAGRAAAARATCSCTSRRRGHDGERPARTADGRRPRRARVARRAGRPARRRDDRRPPAHERRPARAPAGAPALRRREGLRGRDLEGAERRGAAAPRGRASSSRTASPRPRASAASARPASSSCSTRAGTARCGGCARPSGTASAGCTGASTRGSASAALAPG